MEKMNIISKIYRRTSGISKRIDKIFFTRSPSYYNILAAIFTGATVDLFRHLSSEPETLIEFKLAKQSVFIELRFMKLFVFLLSSVTLAYLGITLQKFRNKAKSEGHFRIYIKECRKQLYIATFIGLVSIILSVVYEFG